MEREGHENVGMADIAAAASVAISTVSRALSGSPGVSATKRREIIDLARQLGYLNAETKPSEPSHSREHRITAVVPESDRWIFGSILAGIHDVLTSENVSLQVKQGLSATQRERFLSNPNLANQTDLVILVPAPRDMTPQDLSQLPVPTVIAGTVVPGIPSVGIDDVEVGHKATNYLRNLGLESIAYVGFLDHDGTTGVATYRRGRGYEEAMAKAALPAWHVKVPLTPNPGQAAAEALLAAEHLPQGIICSSDEIAGGMMATFRQAGVSIPEDISIVGVDNHPITEFLGLTTIGQPAREQGREAARLALRILSPNRPRISGPPDSTLESVTFPTRLIVRETTRRAGT